MEWETAGLLKASLHRQQILKMLRTQPMTPSEIAKTLSVHLSQVTRNLGELEERGLVECKNPQMRKGRIYAITRRGTDILTKMNLA
jgi:predicted transcriptional regulator